MYEQKKPCPLLIDGKPNRAGFAKKLYWQYSKEAIKANKLRTKEWDYYLVMNKE